MLRVIFSKKILKYLFILTLLLSFTVLIGALNAQHPHVLPAISLIMAQHRVGLLVLRLSLLALLFLAWPSLVRHLAIRQRWSAEKIVFWLHQRGRLLLWLLAVELIVIDNLFGFLVSLI